MDASGNISGVSDQSTAFELSPNGDGPWNPAVIYTLPFKNPNYGSFGTPVLDKAGNLHCTVGNQDGFGDVLQADSREETMAISASPFFPIWPSDWGRA
jgi:hypothetical protein